MSTDTAEVPAPVEPLVKVPTLNERLGLREVANIDADLASASELHVIGKARGEKRPLPKGIDALLDERLAQTVAKPE